MIARIAFALPFGAVVTAGLLFSMHMFIETGHGQTEATTFRKVDFVRVERNEAPQVSEHRPDRPRPLETAPEMAHPEVVHPFPSTLAVGLAAPDIRLSRSIGGISMTPSDGEYLPIVKVAPIYPMRALQRRLEGYVIVEFIVTSSGSVRNVSVIESSSPLFDQAAIDAAMKFRYKPRVVDGTAIEVAGVQNRITFRLEA